MAKSVTKEGDVCLFTMPHQDLVKGAKMTIDMAGEYEISGINVRGIQTRAHMDTEQERNATIYKITAGDVRILVIGHIYPKLSESKLEDIGLVDVMLIPVGGAPAVTRRCLESVWDGAQRNYRETAVQACRCLGYDTACDS